MFDGRHYRDPMFWGCMLIILVGAGIACTCLLAKRACGIGYGWWEHGSARCVYE